MQKTNIDWVRNEDGTPGYSWNPITGCLGKCPWCYARRIYKRFKMPFKPKFHKNRLREPNQLVKKPCSIFVGSVSDLWGKGVKPEWRLDVLDHIDCYPGHTFFALTKQPQNIPRREKIPKNLWVGVSITVQKEMTRWIQLVDRTENETKRFISFEPILGRFDLLEYKWEHNGKDARPDWLIMGGLTGSKLKTPKEYAERLLSDLAVLNRPILVKDNLRGIMADRKIRKEFPLKEA